MGLILHCARALHAKFERQMVRERNGFYTPRAWESLPERSRVEFVEVAAAALYGSTRDGVALHPTVLETVNEARETFRKETL